MAATQSPEPQGELSQVQQGKVRPATWAVEEEGFREEVTLSWGGKDPGLGLHWVETVLGP